MDDMKTLKTESKQGFSIKDKIEIMNEEERFFFEMLINENQSHIFNDWDKIGINEDKKHQFFNQLKQLDESYHGGLLLYLNTARKLLSDAKKEINVFEGWKVDKPNGVTIEPFTNEYFVYEQKGLNELHKVGFILVAGGLGERLGYNGIKIELPIELTTGISYIEFYIKQILAIQNHFHSSKDILLPLTIMVSDDTELKTIELLHNNNNFSMKSSQITIIKQEKVPALISNSAKISMLNPYCINTKPHGHGDVHSLMYSQGIASKWLENGIKWVVFFQDTNSLAFHTLAAMIGVSLDLNLDVNSLAIPRVAKQPIGAITKLTNCVDQKSITINVEYNQLDSLLKSNSLSRQGDINDPISNTSIYPGNINQLLLKLQPYVNTLNKFQGQVAGEFINPKYTDATRNAFKSPTRLECMMQDYPKILKDDITSHVGFICFPSWICFSACKNNYIDAIKYYDQGIPAACASVSESDHYYCQAEMLRRMGVAVPIGDLREFNHISVNVGPRICIDPSIYLFPSDYLMMFTYPSKVKISKKSTLIITGNVEILCLFLDGAVHFEAVAGTKLIVTNDHVVRNEGFVIEDIDSSDENNNTIFERMRGYKINKKYQEVISTKDIHYRNNLSHDKDIDIINNPISIYYYIGNSIITSSEFYNINNS